MLWEHEVYNSMEYKAPISYFHTFEAEDCMAAFNFASETEAITLRYVNGINNFATNKKKTKMNCLKKKTSGLHTIHLEEYLIFFFL